MVLVIEKYVEPQVLSLYLCLSTLTTLKRGSKLKTFRNTVTKMINIVGKYNIKYTYHQDSFYEGDLTGDMFIVRCKTTAYSFLSEKGEFTRLMVWHWGFPGGSEDKVSTCNAGDPGSIPGLEDPLEKEMATHSSILAWRIP